MVDSAVHLQLVHSSQRLVQPIDCSLRVRGALLGYTFATSVRKRFRLLELSLALETSRDRLRLNQIQVVLFLLDRGGTGCRLAILNNKFRCELVLLGHFADRCDVVD